MKFLMTSLCLALLIFSLSSCSKKSAAGNKKVVGKDAFQGADIASASTDLKLNGATASQVVLKNGLKVVLVSSPTSKVSSAAVGAQIGQHDDPIEAQGLAHFLEHMLFLGTKEFPIVGEYAKFLQANGGGSNAYTGGNITNYFFQIRPDKFEEATHRLSRFFVNPLFDKTYLEKEKSAVHNEFNLRFEDRKPTRTFMAFTKVEGQFRGFGVGNSDTLSEVTAEDTRKLFDEHYYAEAMHAVLSGPQSLEELEALAVKYFSDIKSNPKKALNTYDKFLQFDFEQLPAQVKIKPNDQTKSVGVFIPVQNPKKEKKLLLSALSSLVADESPESLMVFLQSKGLARQGSNALSGAVYPSGVSIEVKLSDEGLQNTDEVVNYVWGYLQFLANQELPSYLKEEIVKSTEAATVAKDFFSMDANTTENINAMYFDREEKPKNWKELFTGAPIEKNITVENYKNYLKRLDISKVLIQVTDPKNKDLDYSFERLEAIDKAGVVIKEVGSKKAVVDSLYKFAFEVEAVDSSKFLAEGDFSLKKPNIYIPKAFDIYKDAEKAQPFAKAEGDFGTVYATDFNDTVLPKIFLSLEMTSDKIDFSNKEDALGLFLLREMLRQQASSQAYAMLTAGFENSFPIYVDKGAIGFNFNGWSDTYQKSFSDFLSFTNLKLSKEGYEGLKALYTQLIKLEESGTVDRIGNREAFSLITPAYLSYKDIYSALGGMTYEKYLDFVSRYFSGLHFRGALTGNLNSSETLDSIVSSIKEHWDPKWAAKESWSDIYNLEELISLKEGDNKPKYSIKQIEGTSKENSLYFGYRSFSSAKSVKEKLMASIVGTWLRPDFYGELRTNRQLAYSLYAVHRNFMDMEGLQINLLSSTVGPDAIEREVDGYLLTWANEVLPMKTEALLESAVKNILINREVPASSVAAHAFYSKLVSSGYSNLAAFEAEVGELKKLKLQDVVSYGQEKIVKNGKRGAFVKVTRKQD